MLNSQWNIKLHAKTPVSLSSPLLCIFGIWSGSGWDSPILDHVFCYCFPGALWHSWGHYSVWTFPFQSSQCPLSQDCGWLMPHFGWSAPRLLLSGSPCWKTWFVMALRIIISYYCYYQGRKPNYFWGFFALCNLSPGWMWGANSSSTGSETWLGRPVWTTTFALPLALVHANQSQRDCVYMGCSCPLDKHEERRDKTS